MPTDPTKVDANFQVANLPTPGGGNSLWSQQRIALADLTEYNDLSFDLSGGRPVNLILESPSSGSTYGLAVVTGLDIGAYAGPPVPVVQISNSGQGVILLAINHTGSAAANRFTYANGTPDVYACDLGLRAGGGSFTLVGPKQWRRGVIGTGISPGMVFKNSVTDPCTIIEDVTWDWAFGQLDVFTNRDATVMTGTYTSQIRPTLALYAGQSCLCVYDTTQSLWQLESPAQGMRWCHPTNYPSTPTSYGLVAVFTGFQWETLPRGSDGQVLTVDSQTRLGVKWV